MLQLNPSGSAARYAEIAARNDGSNTISIIVRPSSGGMLFDIANFHINGVNIAGILQADNIQPRLDDSFDLGTASLRFDDVYATNGVIQTSDATEKSGLRALGDAEKAAIRRVISGIGAFQWRSALAQKGEDARIHCGVTAQAVKDAFEAEGLDPGRYALFCADAVDEAVPEGADEVPDAVAGRAYQAQAEAGWTRRAGDAAGRALRPALRHGARGAWLPARGMTYHTPRVRPLARYWPSVGA